MSSMSKKLSLNFSRGLLARKKGKVHDDYDPPNPSLLTPTIGLAPPTGNLRCNSMTNINTSDSVAGAGGDSRLERQCLNRAQISEITDLVRSFSGTLHRLQELFEHYVGQEKDKDKPAPNGCEDVRLPALDKLGETMALLITFKKYPAILNSDVLRAAHEFIVKLKFFDYSKLPDGVDKLLDVIDRLAMHVSGSVSDFLIKDIEGTSGMLKRSMSCDSIMRAARHNEDQSVQDQEGTKPQSRDPDVRKEPTEVDVEEAMSRLTRGVDLSLDQAKSWGTYAKAVSKLVDQRSSLIADLSKNLAKLSSHYAQVLDQEAFLPFQSIYVSSLQYDGDTTLHKQAVVRKLEKVVEALNSRIREHERIRKQLKEQWERAQKKLQEAAGNIVKARSQYNSRQGEFEKAHALTKTIEAEKLEKKKKTVEELQIKALDAEAWSKQCVNLGNTKLADLEDTKEQVLGELWELMMNSEKVMKEVTINYFNQIYADHLPVSPSYENYSEQTSQYVVGCTYKDFLKSVQQVLVCKYKYLFMFKPYNPDTKDPRKLSAGLVAIPIDDATASPVFPDPSRLLTIRLEDHASGESENESDSASPACTPTLHRQLEPPNMDKKTSIKVAADNTMVSFPGVQIGMRLSEAGMSHRFRRLHHSPGPTCGLCDLPITTLGLICNQCGLAVHLDRCSENITTECPQSRLQETGAFGVDLQVHLQRTQTRVPPLVTQCLQEIEEHGLDIKGIYRISAVKSKVDSLCQMYDKNPLNMDLSDQSPVILSNVLKQYLRELPEPLLTIKLYNEFIAIAKSDEPESALQQIRGCIASLPTAHRRTLVVLMRHLNIVSTHMEENQMSASNLAIVFGPNLLRPPKEVAGSVDALKEAPLQQKIVDLMITHVEELFPPKKTQKVEKEHGKGAGGTVAQQEPGKPPASIIDTANDQDNLHDTSRLHVHVDSSSLSRTHRRRSSDPAHSPNPSNQTPQSVQDLVPDCQVGQIDASKDFTYKSMTLTFAMLHRQQKSSSMSDLTKDLINSRGLTRPVQFSPNTPQRKNLYKRLNSKESELRTLGEGGVWIAITDADDQNNSLINVLRRHPKLSSPVKKQLLGLQDINLG